MKIGIVGPLATANIKHLIDDDTSQLPREMKGGTLLVPLIEVLIHVGREVVALTTDSVLVARRDNRVTARGHNFNYWLAPV